MRRYLELKGLWTKEKDEALRKELDDAIAETIRQVERAPPPPIESLFDDVSAELSPALREQMDEFLKSGERRRPEILDKFPL
jgi:2-oxoisovalerate dehydrogenase E1 component alpha subunit